MDILDRITEGFVALDRAWRYTFVNQRAASMFGRTSEQLVGKHIWTEFHEGIAQPFHLASERAMATQQPIQFEEYYPPLGRWFAHRVYPSKDGVSIFFEDITERRLREDALRESEAKFRALAENTPDLISRIDPDGRYLYVNPAFTRYVGRSSEEILGKTNHDLGYSEELCRAWDAALRSVQDTRAIFEVDRELPGAHGARRFTVRLIPEVDTGGRVTSAIFAGQDITARKQAEEAAARSYAELRALSARMERVREEERAELAREIHDELGQSLTGLKMDTVWLERRVKANREGQDRDATLDRLARMGALLDETMRTMRRIATDLRPPILDDLGLVAAVRWQAEEFSRRTGLPVDISAPETVPTGRDVSVALFRILQESLTNVARHAQARHVSVRLDATAQDVMLSISDDGVGFIPGMRRSASLGLLGMRERTEYLGGSLIVESAPGRGATIIVRIPL